MKTEKEIPYHPIITHDVDRLFKWKAFKSIFGETGRIISGKSTWSLQNSWMSFLKRKQEDPFNNLLQVAEIDLEYGMTPVFYIMTTEELHPKNINDYSVEDQDIKDTLGQLIKMECEIGIHPGIFTFDNPQKMKKQKEALESAIGQQVVRSRQHYLNYQYPDTFKHLVAVGIENDSSILVDLSIEDNPDKKSTYVMSDYDGSKMNITQTPLVFMDTHHMTMKDDEILSKLEESVAPSKQHGGEVMILWHNNNISNDREIGLYKEALEVIKNLN